MILYGNFRKTKWDSMQQLDTFTKDVLIVVFAGIWVNFGRNGWDVPPEFCPQIPDKFAGQFGPPHPA